MQLIHIKMLHARTILLSNVRFYQRMSAMFPVPDFDSFRKVEQEEKPAYKMFKEAQILQSASPGTYFTLPLLTRSLRKLHHIIHEEMNGIGAQEVTLPCLTAGALWKQSKRWQEMGPELIRFKDRSDIDQCLSPTHEEAITTLVKNMHTSYKQLPLKLYQLGRKFRDEANPKNGLLRCKEFEMKDLYSFDADQHNAISTYEEIKQAYMNVFNRLGLDFCRVEADSGAMGGSVSHEFHLVSPLGEDLIYKCRTCGSSFNAEVVEKNEGSNNSDVHCGMKNGKDNATVKCDFEKASAIEIAHSFILGTKYSKAFNACYFDTNKKLVPYYMGCYGIGVTRLLQASVEVLSDGESIRWPNLIAPYQITIVPQRKGYKCEEIYSLAETLSNSLTASLKHLKGEILLDDRLQMTIGKRVTQSKFLGIPHIIVLGKKSLESPAVYEYINVYENTTDFLTEEQLLDVCSMNISSL